MKFSDLKFCLKTGHFPSTYRKLFRELSNLYLTPASPGRVHGKDGLRYTFTTNGGRMFVGPEKLPCFWIDRQTLEVESSIHASKKFPLHAPEVRPLKNVLDDMLKRGIPFKMSDTNVTNLGI